VVCIAALYAMQTYLTLYIYVYSPWSKNEIIKIKRHIKDGNKTKTLIPHTAFYLYIYAYIKGYGKASYRNSTCGHSDGSTGYEERYGLL
jgi:hypothetical protein